jgi:alkylated DNA repair dioxygenase AlkB
MSEPSLFDSHPDLPEGFKYQPEVISREQEQALIASIQTLPLKEFEFHGYTGKRRVVSFGWRYDFSDRELQKADDIPLFLAEVRRAAADFAGLAEADLRHVLITEYSPGSAIGWHKDKGVFAEVVGISLGSACPFRLRRKVGAKWERKTITAEPRSAYLLSAVARSEWEHSIPPVEELRYSLTFRNVREP